MNRKPLLWLLLAIIAVVAEQTILHVSWAQNQSNAEYRISPHDVLNIKVGGSIYDETVEVDGCGMIQLRFTDSDIQAAGKTVDELKDEVVIKLKKLLKNPSVEIRLIRRGT